MVAVDGVESLADEEPQPEEKRQSPIREVGIESLRRLEERLLNHVGRIDPPA